LKPGGHDIDEEVILCVSLEGNIAVGLLHDFVDFAAFLSGDKFLQFVRHLTTYPDTIRKLFVKRNIAFEKEIQKYADGIVVAVDLKAVAGVVYLGSGIPCKD
jgi:hypothetical protein